MRQIFLSLLLVGLFHSSIAQNWQPLFNGKDLTGWESRGGKAPYVVEDGVIVGTAVLNTPNTFLCTKKTYSDFILEFEILLPNHLNTGVQFRSNFSNVVNGYQCEIDPSTRAFSGGIYDEQRRGWMYPISLNPKANDAFQLGMWNKVRIECLGNEIRTYINGQMCSNLVDDMTNEGFIGLQVHSIGEKEKGYVVKWKNLQILTEDVATFRFHPDPEVMQMSYLKNELTDWEKRNGWRLLWDGATPAGWRGAKLDEFPESGWQMKDGELTVLATDGGESTGPGDIVTTSNYSNFELELEFKITEGANSGIKYFVDPSLNKGQGSAIGCEFQILDDQRHPDAKMGVNGNRTVGSLYDLITAENLSVPGRGKQFKGIGKWNKARIVSRDGKVEHWLNNEKIIEYDRNSQIFKALVAYSKYKDWPNFGRWPEGSILLQDHGNEVSFRSIKIRELN
ncbi:MAG: hypothetical protein CMP48_05500 [Rickettsiales bacterium]|nr:hypothetical protein [Rickettsiales bacterium]